MRVMRVVTTCATSVVISVCSIEQNVQATTTSLAADSSSDVTVLAAVPHIVTADIQAGIETYIQDQTTKGNGEFPLMFDGEELLLKLVRVHTEYLARLGPHSFFACVDLATEEGNVYDVDFFMAGDKGNMTVTETTVHKINGQPYYVWEQNSDKVWVRETVDEASRALLGVIEGNDQFEFLYQVTLPKMSDNARMWIPLPSSDAFQTIGKVAMQVPGEKRILTDRRFENKVLFLELTPEDSGKVVSLRFDVKRIEKTVYSDDSSSPKEFLSSNNNVPITDEFRAIAKKAIEGKDSVLVRARALYDVTIEKMRYAKFGTEYGKGDAQFACDSSRGNCTDYHSYFIALSRSVGIPARFAIGAAVPASRDDGALSGYHCWAEFYAEGKWWPVDISEADKFTGLSTYYFGHNPANRVEFSRGRDLEVVPSPASGPINFLADPLLEVADVPVKVKPLLSFTRTTQ